MGGSSWCRKPRTMAAVGALLLLSVACSDGDDGETATDDGSAAATGTTVVDPAGFPVYDVADRQEERWEILHSPDWLIADDDGVWVKRDDGGVDYVDAETNELVERVEPLPGEHVCQGIGLGFGSLWTCANDTDVVRVDPDTGEVVSELKLGKAASQGHLPTDFDHLWVLTGDGSTLVGVDPATEEVTVTIELGARGTQVESGEAGLWVASTIDDQVLRIDPETGEVALRIETILQPTSVVVTDDVWVGASLSTNQVDPESGEVLLTSDIGTGANGCLTIGEDGVWVRNADPFLTRLDPSDASPVERIISPDTPSGGDTIVAFGSVWTTAYDHVSLFRLDPSP